MKKKQQPFIYWWMRRYLFSVVANITFWGLLTISEKGQIPDVLIAIFLIWSMATIAFLIGDAVVALAKEEIKDKKQARANKRRRGNADVGMSNKAFWLTVGWCAFVALVVILVGAGVLVLSDPVLIALIASAGLPAIIKALSGWFKSDKSE